MEIIILFHVCIVQMLIKKLKSYKLIKIVQARHYIRQNAVTKLVSDRIIL